jgi:threonine dehydrogenase-like Zn-dependent dehydrogenase
MVTSARIPKEMRAVVLERAGTLSVKEIPTWQIADYGDPDMVLVKVSACGVCGSDFRYYQGENPWAQATLGRYVPNPPNIVMGHEVSGEVVAVLDTRNEHLLGTRVAVLDWKACGTCPACRSERSNLCSSMIHLGHGQGWGQRDYYPGAYAQYVPAWGSSCLEVPAAVSSPAAAMMDILAVAVHVAERGNICPGMPALIMGAGPAGNSIAQAARYLGASPVVVLDRADVPLRLARGLAFDTVIDVRGMTSDTLEAELRRHAPDGFSTVFDSIGTDDSFLLGITVTGRHGTFVEMAVHDGTFSLNYLRLGSERTITTSCNFAPRDFPLAMKWLESRRFLVDDWFARLSLEEVPTRFEDVVHNGRDAFKYLIDMER